MCVCPFAHWGISPMCSWAELTGDLLLHFFCVGNALPEPVQGLLCRKWQKTFVWMIWWIDICADAARRTRVASFLSTFLSCCPQAPGQGWVCSLSGGKVCLVWLQFESFYQLNLKPKGFLCLLKESHRGSPSLGLLGQCSLLSWVVGEALSVSHT